MDKNKMIIGITGTLGAGKGTIVEYLVKQKNFTHYSVRDFLIEELNKRGLEINRDNMVEVANDLRAKHSPSYIAEELCKRANEKGGNAVIESIRTPGEVEALKKLGAVLFAVDADQKTRYERIHLRGSSTDQVSFEKFVEDEEKEMTSDDPNKQNLSKCFEIADYKFNNDGTIEDLHKQVEDVLNGIKQ